MYLAKVSPAFHATGKSTCHYPADLCGIHELVVSGSSPFFRDRYRFDHISLLITLYLYAIFIHILPSGNLYCE